MRTCNALTSIADGFLQSRTVDRIYRDNEYVVDKQSYK